MSLISDALKKARQEAARQDALHQGVPYAVGSAESPVRRSPFLPVLGGLGAGCFFAALLFAVAWGAAWGPFAKPPAPAAAQTAQDVPVSPPPAIEIREEPPAVPTEPVPSETTTATPPSPIIEPKLEPPPLPPAPTAAAPPVEVPRSEPVAPPAAPPAEAAPTPVPAAPPVAESSASPPPSASAGGLEDGKVYIGEVPVPGGGSLKLNGIAFSQDHPVAVLDGRVMGPGEVIQGFTVVTIESGRVKLQGYGATVFLSPR